MMSKEDGLRDILDETAKEMALVDNNPRTWQSWMVYLLGRLDREAMDENPAHKMAFDEMLVALEDAIRNRMKTGGW